MKTATISAAVIAVAVALLALAAQGLEPAAAAASAAIAAMMSSNATTPQPVALADVDLLYGRITTDDGVVYEGRLRWGGDEEALWANYFNGFKEENPWADYVPSGRLPNEQRSIDLLGFKISGWDRPIDLGRPLMMRFGHIARIDPIDRDVWLTLRSGSKFRIDRYGADDMNDGVRVWDRSRGVVDLDEWHIHSIELLASPPGAGSHPLQGTVHTRAGDFTGLVQWDRLECLGSDELDGRNADRDLAFRFDTIRAIARRSDDNSMVTLVDGREE
jgi:hypothetical protein